MTRAAAGLAVVLSLFAGPLAGIVCGLSCARSSPMPSHHHHHDAAGSEQGAGNVAVQAEHVCVHADDLAPAVVTATQAILKNGTVSASVPSVTTATPQEAHAVLAARSGSPPGGARRGSPIHSGLRI